MDKEKIKELCDKIEHLVEWAEIGVSWTRDQATSASTEEDAQRNLDLAHQEEKELVDFLMSLVPDPVEEEQEIPVQTEDGLSARAALSLLEKRASEGVMALPGVITEPMAKVSAAFKTLHDHILQTEQLQRNYKSLKVQAFAAMYGASYPAQEQKAGRIAQSVTEALDALEHLNKEAREGNIAVYDGEENCEALLQDIKDAYRILWDYITGANTRNIQNLPMDDRSAHARLFQVLGEFVPEEAADGLVMAIRQYDGSFVGQPLMGRVLEGIGDFIKVGLEAKNEEAKKRMMNLKGVTTGRFMGDSPNMSNVPKMERTGRPIVKEPTEAEKEAPLTVVRCSSCGKRVLYSKAYGVTGHPDMILCGSCPVPKEEETTSTLPNILSILRDLYELAQNEDEGASEDYYNIVRTYLTWREPDVGTIMKRRQCRDHLESFIRAHGGGEDSLAALGFLNATYPDPQIVQAKESNRRAREQKEALEEAGLGDAMKAAGDVFRDLETEPPDRQPSMEEEIRDMADDGPRDRHPNTEGGDDREE